MKWLTFEALLLFCFFCFLFVQDASNKNTLDALGTALEQESKDSSSASKSQTPPSVPSTAKGIFDIPKLQFGMTCEQAQAALMRFNK